MSDEIPACYCTALRSATRRVISLYDAALEPVGVGAAQLALLRAIERSKAPPSLTELGRGQGLERSTVGRNLKVLARMGLVELDGDDGDLRASVAMLTPKGRDALARAEPIWAGVQRTIEDRLGAGDAGRLLAALNGL